MSDKPTPWSVLDSNAYETRDGEPVARVHEVGGKRYKLYATEPCPVPEEHARVFLKDPAFTVMDAEGNVVPSLDAEQQSRKPPEELAPGTVIAKIDELTDEALLTRCAILPGGSNFTADTPREQMLDFLLEYQEALATPAGGRDDDFGDDAVPDRQLDRLLGKPNLPPRPPKGSNVARMKPGVKPPKRVTADDALAGA